MFFRKSHPLACARLRALWKDGLLPPAMYKVSRETEFNLAAVQPNAQAVCQD